MGTPEDLPKNVTCALCPPRKTGIHHRVTGIALMKKFLTFGFHPERQHIGMRINGSQRGQTSVYCVRAHLEESHREGDCGTIIARFTSLGEIRRQIHIEGIEYVITVPKY